MNFREYFELEKNKRQLTGQLQATNDGSNRTGDSAHRLIFL
jgi:hypothetical protein